MKITNICIALSLSLLAALAAGGPLTPPGAPASTMKTLDEVEARTPIHAEDIPLTITEPGSYYLAENIAFTGTAEDVDGIHINVSHVTIDLNGFTFKGPGTGPLSIDGIESEQGTSGTVIRNGTITKWPNNGISLLGDANLIKDVSATHNGSDGIAINTGVIIDCHSSFNVLSGIALFSGSPAEQSKISGCVTNNNGTDGIRAPQPAVILNNTASGNGKFGIVAYGTPSRIVSNDVTNNTLYGIFTNASNIISIKNTASNNGSSFVFQAGGVYGPVVNMTVGGEIPTATNPLANIIY